MNVRSSSRFRGLFYASVCLIFLAGIISRARAAGCTTPPAGLVSWWRAEGNGQDEAGANNGTVIGSTPFLPGEVGQAFNLGGPANYVQIPASPSLDVGLGNGFSIEFWLKPNDLTGGHPVFDWNDGSGNTGVHLWVSIPGFGGLGSIFANLIDTSGGNRYFASSPNVLNTTAFQHIALTFDKTTGTGRLFLNGVQVAVQSLGSFTPRTSYPLSLGKRVSGDQAGTSLAGLLDEFAIYNRVLGSNEVQAIYNAGTAGKCAGPNPPYIFGQPTSQTVLVGSSATLAVFAAGTFPLGYQWSLNGTNIAGATNSSLQLTNIQFANAGIYNVLITNAYGTVISSNAVLTVLTSFPCTAPPSGLVSWWPGEGNALDSSSANNGVLSNGTVFATGKVGQGFRFDGVNSAVVIPAAANLAVQSFTIEGWLLPQDLTPRPIVEYANPSGRCSVNFWYNAGDGASDRPGAISGFARDSSGDFGVASPGGLLSTNQWNHVALTYNYAQRGMTLYVNGAQAATTTFSSAVAPQTLVNVNLGYRPVGSAELWAGRHHLGGLDEVSIYNRALSASELQAIYNASSTGKCSTPTPPFVYSQPTNQTVFVGGAAALAVVAGGSFPLSYQWSFNGTNIAGATQTSLQLTNVQPSQAGSYAVLVTNAYGSTSSSNAVLTVSPPPPCSNPPSGLVTWWRAEGNALDQTGNNDGTVFGATPFLPGEVGQAFNLSGPANYVQIPASPSLDVGLGNGFSIEFWLKPNDLTSGHPVFDWNDGAGNMGVHLWVSIPGYGGLGSIFANVMDTTGADRYFASSPNVLNTTNFQHIALTFDKTTGTGRLFLNGVQVAVQSLGSFTPRTSYPLYLGKRISGPLAGSSLAGLLDEFAIYNRPLGSNEIQAIYAASAGGKCPVPTPPFIITQPSSQSVLVGSNVTFTAAAGGTRPLTYQWNFNGNVIANATNSSLTLTNVQLNRAGNYSVSVSNAVGGATSSNALLTVTYPAAPVRVVSVTNSGGSTIVVPITLGANGNENGVGLSLNFSTSRLAYASVALGAGANGATLLINSSQVDNGRLGIALALSPGSTFPPGTQELVNVTFTSSPVTNNTATTISFGDSPIVRQLSDPPGNSLAATWSSGLVVLNATDFEADVAPRPNGNRAVTITDWVTIGQFAARLDYPSTPSEFQRADCAPRSSLGNGSISVSDWVQAGRYAAALDPLTPVGGPTANLASPVPDPAPRALGRELAIGDSTIIQGQTGSVSVLLESQGNENALGFSLLFDPAVFSYQSSRLGSAVTNGTFNVNTNQLASGRLACVLALSSGAAFAAGDREVFVISLAAAANASGSNQISFGDQPVGREIADATAATLAARYLSGTVLVTAPPSLRIAQFGTNVTLAWPQWATGYNLQETLNALGVTNAWTNLVVNPTQTNGENRLTLPLTSNPRFYRLYHP